MKILYPRWSKGTDALAAALCSLGVFSRTPKRGAARHSRRRRLTASELVEIASVPKRFRQAMVLYLETYEVRVSDVCTALCGINPSHSLTFGTSSTKRIEA